MQVGMIGLGRMGAGMAANLLQGGHQVVVYNRTPAKAEALIAQGAKAVADVSDACRQRCCRTWRPLLAVGGHGDRAP
jgi:3-hydroxyisobutyrate dehydrogenase-like beta-hydroxyacid dehydrogenase